jgi:predicted metal-dependent HD superfamily phosphohydrolase
MALRSESIHEEAPFLVQVETYASEILKKELAEQLAYHDYDHTARVVAAAKEIGTVQGLDEEEMEILLMAAWFHDTGFRTRQEGHEEVSQGIAREFLDQIGFLPSKIDRVCQAIGATKMPQNPTSKLEEVLCDADMAHLAAKDFIDKAAALRKEWDLMGNKTFPDDHAWYQSNIDFIRSHRYFTGYGQQVLEKKKQKNLQKLEKLKENANGQHTPEEMLKQLGWDERTIKKVKKQLEAGQENETKPSRSIDTMFRITSQNHVQFSSMADSKANIMISVNSITITILISILVRKLDTNPHLVIPTIIILSVCLGAIVFAVLATRPIITPGRFTKEDIHDRKINLLFFGNFYRMELTDYEWGMQQMLKDNKYLYLSMIKDIYYLGVVLGKKYKFLRISYNIFMYGLIIASLAFILAVVWNDAPLQPVDPASLIDDLL